MKRWVKNSITVVAVLIVISFLIGMYIYLFGGGSNPNPIEHVTNSPSLLISVKDGWICYYDGTTIETTVYKIKIDGTEKTKLNQDEASEFIKIYNMNNVIGDCFYDVNESDGNKLYKYSDKGVAIDKVTEDKCGWFDINGNVIYYGNYGENPGIYKVNPDGSGNKKISSEQIDTLDVENGWIYYLNTRDSFRLYKMRINGTGRKLLSDETVKSQSNIIYSDGYVFFQDGGNNGGISKIKVE